MKLQIIFATGNENKVREIREIITDPEITVASMKQAGVSADPEEDGETFEENAVIKAKAVSDLIKQGRATGLDSAIPVVVMSDDSGLVIDALGGAPGIQSARFMGHDTSYTLKMNALLEQLSGVPEEKRSARFVAAVAAVVPTGISNATDSFAEKLSRAYPDELISSSDPGLVVRGTMEGRIGHSILGENGFGYDPFFYLPELQKTSAEITPEEKNRLSHRGQALRRILHLLTALDSQNS